MKKAILILFLGGILGTGAGVGHRRVLLPDNLL